ncbi:hypothetical protein LTR17_026082 [Elasticomyces elasticus]|nr:hypothetical protein LTR17_026082 [Elasticomyces elasticus]
MAQEHIYDGVALPERLFISFSELCKCLDEEKDTGEGLIFGTSPSACHILLGHRGTPGISAKQFAIFVDDRLRIALQECGSSFVRRPIKPRRGQRVPPDPCQLSRGSVHVKGIVIHAGRLTIGLRFLNHGRASSSYLENLRTLTVMSRNIRARTATRRLANTAFSDVHGLRTVTHGAAYVDQQVEMTPPSRGNLIKPCGVLDIIYRSGGNTDTYRQATINGTNFTVRLSDGWVDSLEILSLASLSDCDRARYRLFLAKYVKSSTSVNTKRRRWINLTDAKLLIKDLGLSALLGDVIAVAAHFSRPGDTQRSEAFWIKTNYKCINFGNHQLSMTVSYDKINATQIYKAAGKSTNGGHLGDHLRNKNISFERLIKGPRKHRGLYVATNVELKMCQELGLTEIANTLSTMLGSDRRPEFSMDNAGTCGLHITPGQHESYNVATEDHSTPFLVLPGTMATPCASHISNATMEALGLLDVDDGRSALFHADSTRHQSSAELQASYCSEPDYRFRSFLQPIKTPMLAAHVPVADGTDTAFCTAGEGSPELSELFPDLPIYCETA